MLNQLLTHTPVYVWIILAILVWRGLVERREREVAPRRLVVVPLLMLALALSDIVARFEGASLALPAWALSCAGAALAVRRFGRSRVAGTGVSQLAHRVRLRGSVTPLLLMMAIFAVKYALAVALALRPGALREPAFALAVCACLGVFNGVFLGRLVLDMAACRQLLADTPA